jgi:hypothetical protein
MRQSRRPAVLAASSVTALLGALTFAASAAAFPHPIEPVPEWARDGEPTPANPCHDPQLRLACPNLRMKPPFDLRVRRVGGQVRLLAANHIVNVGQGPLELIGRRGSGRGSFASATQVIRTRGGGRMYFPRAGWIYWKAIPGQDHYWKFFHAARFELWTLNADGSPRRMVRTGPKLTYCFRDLRRVRSWRRTPRRQVYPACSQDARRRNLRLGVSPGWADIYPATYHENWISIRELRGCFAFVHRVDPYDELIEESEDDNVGSRIIRLPPRGRSVAPRGCPGR